MNFDFKNIHIGQIIKTKVSECEDASVSRICNFFNCNEKTILMMYTCENLETDLLLKWSKLLEYDFFRIYTQHLILYSPPSREDIKKTTKSALPQFRKNIYTKEIIQFILELIEKGEKDRKEIISEYKIPKTTLYKWIIKYSSNY
ncbi:transposase [Chryseobacterium sp. HMWF035]|nr:transposase [Chryseobacterium sp. HMWF001]PVV51663.1 transposase [Chryseobacterium sp. HMWF035]